MHPCSDIILSDVLWNASAENEMKAGCANFGRFAPKIGYRVGSAYPMSDREKKVELIMHTHIMYLS